jgi:16S rRNA processing protein RimM
MAESSSTWLEIGKVDKAHGLKGEVTVRLTTNVDDRLSAGMVLRVGERELTIASLRPHTDRWIVWFEGIDDRTAAEALRGRRLYAPPLDPDADPDALWVHELLGATVVDTTGAEVGTVTDMIENPASDLLVIDDGPLVPLVFVTGWDDERRVVIDPPDGLFDLD